jgi:tetratricopeptide (TPR) repeat protein
MSAARPIPKQKTLRGVFSTPFMQKLSGGGVRYRKVYWAAYDMPDGEVEIQPLTEKMLPMGAPRRITHDDFLKNFNPEPGFYIKELQKGAEEAADETVAPDTDGAPDLHDALGSSDAPDTQGTSTRIGHLGSDHSGQHGDHGHHAGTQPQSSEPGHMPQGSWTPAQEIAAPAGTTEHVPAPAHDVALPDSDSITRQMTILHAEGRAALLHGRVDQAVTKYRSILDLDGPFEASHKFVLSDCGIDMRKVGRYDDAIAFYRRALELAETDENLYHNTARAFYEKGDIELARKYLHLSLFINPELRESRMFLRFIDKHFLAPDPQGLVPQA